MSGSTSPRALLPFLGLLALLGQGVSCGDDTESEDRLAERSDGVLLCREVELAALWDPATGQSKSDFEVLDPGANLVLPAAIAAVNPHPDVTVWLYAFDDLDQCAYKCPVTAGACSADTYELVSCASGASAGHVYPGVSAVELSIDVDGSIPGSHGDISASLITQEAEPCPSACAALDPPLDDGDSCTLDQCVFENGSAVIVRANLCAPGAIDPGVATTVLDALEELTEGSSPIIRDLDAAMIAPDRAASLHGRVLRGDSLPAVGALVAIAGHPEYGWTETDGAGEYVMLVEAGAPLTVNVSSPGYLPVHRTVVTRPQHWATVDDVVLTELSREATRVDLVGAASMTMVPGAIESDVSGSRKGTLLVPAATVARLDHGGVIDPDPLDAITVRITEYTVGSSGPQRMPAPLPPASAYTYAVEISVDEAMDAGASGVAFDTPVVYYVDNFLGFPIGGIVPVGRYDRDRMAWVPEPDGMVVRTIAGSPVGVDADGDGDDDSATLGITIEERQNLTSRYGANKSLWRVEVTHLSPIDCNWPYVGADTCGPDECDDDLDEPHDESAPIDDTCEQSGSIIECDNQILGERISLAGTGLTLNYRSDRTPGNIAARSVTASLTEGVVPSTLKSATVTLDVAGKRYSDTLVCPGIGACPQDQTTTLLWDGQDRFGRLLLGRQTATLTWSYEHEVFYGPPMMGVGNSFGGGSGSGGVVLPLVRGPAPRPRTYSLSLGSWDARSFGLGGWSVDAVHAYDPVSRTVFHGDGSRRSVEQAAPMLHVVKDFDSGGDLSVTAAFDGTIYAVERSDPTLHRLDADGGWASLGPIPGFFAADLDVDSEGRPLAAMASGLIQRREANGSWTLLAGSTASGAEAPCAGELATSVPLGNVQSIATSADGNVYFGRSKSICRVAPDGRLYRVAGGSVLGASGDGIRALDATVRIGNVFGMDVAPDGSLIFTNETSGWDIVRRIRTDGIIETIAGTTSSPSRAASVAAHELGVESVEDLVVDAEGTVFFIDTRSYGWHESSQTTVVRMLRDGLVTTIAGKRFPGGCSDDASFCGDGNAAAQTRLEGAEGLAIHPRGLVLGLGAQIAIIEPVLPGIGFDEIVIPAQDERWVDLFDQRGRHLSTRDRLTGATMYEISYDGGGRLASLVDAEGLTTVISRDAQGVATEIVGPYGHTTSLSIDGGWLGSVSDPEGHAHAMTYSAEGLLLSFKTPRNSVASQFSYDTLGRLETDTTPDGNQVSLMRTELDEGRRVSVTSELGYTTEYDVEGSSEESWRRRVEDPAGLVTTSHKAPDETTTITLPDGTVVTTTMGADPLWGSLAPTATRSVIAVPDHPPVTVHRKRTASGLGADPFTFSTIQDEIWVNPAIAGNLPSGPKYTRVYDAVTRTEQWTTPEGRTFARSLDALGRVVSITPPVGTLITFTYDGDGRPWQSSRTVDATNRQTARTYGSSGLLETFTNPKDETSAFEWTLDARLKRVERPDLQAASLTYDTSGLLRTVAPPGRPAHTFGYSSTDTATSYTPPAVSGTGATQLTLDGDGRVDLVTRPDLTIDYRYDSATGRLSKIYQSSVSQIAIDHDAAGRLYRIRGPSWSFGGGSPRATLERTFSGPLMRSEITGGGQTSGTVTWDYDDALRVETETVGGQSGTFAYDDDGLITQSGPLAIVRSPSSGAIESTTVTSGANAIVETRQYHPDTGLLELIEYVRNGSTVLYEATLERDELERVWRKTETVLGATKVLVYEYDLAGRLKKVTTDGVVTEQYGYDANGNRTSASNSGGSKTATYDAQDRMLTHGGASYVWTSFGNLSSRTSPRLLPTYNAFGHLTLAETTAGTSFSYVTDALGRRIRKASGSTILGKWLWRNELAPVAELNASDVLTRRYFYADAPNAPEVIVNAAGTTVWRLIKDDVGSVRLVMNLASATPLRRLDFDAFGRVTAQTGTANIVPFGFAGGFWDPDTKLVRFGARDYDPETGRWLSKDPAQFGGGLNFYVYANNDPVNYVDPNGHVPVPVIIIGASAFASVFFADNAEAAYDAAIAQFVGLGVGSLVTKAGLSLLGTLCRAQRAAPPIFGPGTVGAATPRIIQTGGRTFSKEASDVLNDHAGVSLKPREWGRALESLKGELGLPPNHHGKINSVGDYLDESGAYLGNIQDYLP